MTIELGFAPCHMADERIVGVVDVPGHLDFIRNMVSGAQGIDVVILVVAADDGVMPQTTEHLDILTLLGVRHGLVALTKIDLVDQDMRSLVAEDVRAAVAGTFLADAPICPISNITGEGFGEFFTALNRVCDACQGRATAGLFRMWIERAFKVQGFGAVVSGIPADGEVRVGQRILLLPDGLEGHVRGMEVYGEKADLGQAGECVAINVHDIDFDKLTRGKVLAESDCFAPVTMAEAELLVLPSLPKPLKDYIEVHFHVGTAETLARVAVLDAKALEPGRRHMVQLRLDEPLGLAAGDRFVARAGVAGLAGGRLTTVGGGRILGAGNVRLRRNRPWTLAALAARRDAIDDLSAWCLLPLKEAARPLGADALARLAQRRTERVAEAMELLRARAAVQTLEKTFVHNDVLAEAQQRIVEKLDAFYTANPTRAGMAEDELLDGIEMDPRVLAAAVERLIAAGKLARREAVVSLPGKGAQLSDQDQQLCDRIAQALDQAHLEPPLPADLAASLGVTEARLQAMIDLLADVGKAVRLDRKVVMSAAAVESAKAVVLKLFAQASGFETVQFRDALGVSRKYAVPLLDYFDTVKLTVRSGSRRTPGVEARRMLGK